MTAARNSTAIGSRSETESRLYRQIARAIDYVTEHREVQPELDDIARHVGMSTDHLQRTFTDWAGVSPKKFLKSLTLAAAKERLAASESVLDAAFEAGLSGPGRLHDLFVTVDAVTPGELKSRGDGMVFSYCVHPSPFGACLIVATPRGLTGLSFVIGDRDAVMDQQRQGWENANWIENFDATAIYAAKAFHGGSGDLKLLLRGSAFRVKVWEALLRIPEGALTTYGDLARGLDQPRGARAVAGAVANNLIGYVIPCHRVIRESGALAGYRWDLGRKSAILGREAMRHPQLGLVSGGLNP